MQYTPAYIFPRTVVWKLFSLQKGTLSISIGTSIHNSDSAVLISYLLVTPALASTTNDKLR